MADDLAERLVAEWLDEQEGFASRRERMTEEISARPEAWLEAACRVGITALQAQNRKLVEALKLAANRLIRCSLDYDTGTRQFIEVGEWAEEARAAIAKAEKEEG